MDILILLPYDHANTHYAGLLLILRYVKSEDLGSYGSGGGGGGAGGEVCEN